LLVGALFVAAPKVQLLEESEASRVRLNERLHCSAEASHGDFLLADALRVMFVGTDVLASHPSLRCGDLAP